MAFDPYMKIRASSSNERAPFQKPLFVPLLRYTLSHTCLYSIFMATPLPSASSSRDFSKSVTPHKIGVWAYLIQTDRPIPPTCRLHVLFNTCLLYTFCILYIYYFIHLLLYTCVKHKTFFRTNDLPLKNFSQRNILYEATTITDTIKKYPIPNLTPTHPTLIIIPPLSRNYHPPTHP